MNPEPNMTEAAPGSRELAMAGKRFDPVALGLLALALVLGLHTAWRTGPTFDEHFYIAAGHAYWETGDLALNREHPPLGKLLVGLPLWLAPGVQSDAHALQRVGYPVWFLFQENAEQLARNFFLARLPVVLLTTLLGWVVYRKARACFGRAGGLVALLAFAFNPNVLAQGSLAALDGTLMALFFCAVLAFVELLRTPTWQRALGAALLFGLANLTKQTGLLLGPGFVLAALGSTLVQRSFVPLRSCALVFLGGLGVFTIGYGFEARSLDEAWGSPHYATQRRSFAGTERALVRLQGATSAAVGQGLDAEFARSVAAASDPRAALDLFAGALLQGPASEQAACEVLAQLADPHVADDDLRRRTFHLLLETGEPAPLSVPRQLALAQLAGTDRFAHFVTQSQREAEDATAPAQPGSARAAWRAWWQAGGERSFEAQVFTQPWLADLVRRLFGEQRPVPWLSALKGLDYQLDASGVGHGTMFRGRPLLPQDFKDGNPHPEYYAVVLGIKNPLPWLLLVLAGIALSLRASARAPGWDLARRLGYVGAPLLLLAFFSAGKSLMGVRYVLPVMPFLALTAGRVGASLPRAAVLLAALGALLGLRYHPHHLMYYNELTGGPGSPHGGPRISATSDDWGQAVRAMGAFAVAHAAELQQAGGLYYEPYTVADPAAYGLERMRALTGRVEGIVAVHALAYWRDVVPGSGTERKYAWLDEYEPFLVVDQSVYLYDTREPAPGGDPLPDWAP